MLRLCTLADGKKMPLVCAASGGTKLPDIALDIGGAKLLAVSRPSGGLMERVASRLQAQGAKDPELGLIAVATKLPRACSRAGVVLSEACAAEALIAVPGASVYAFVTEPPEACATGPRKVPPHA